MKFETEVLTDKVRKNLPGPFVKLPLGFTHYSLNEPGDGMVVVLVYGFSSPRIVWEKNIPPY